MVTAIKRSKYWHAAYRIPQDSGKSKLVFKSTKKTSKREARQCAVDRERAARAEASTDEEQARRMLAIITRATEDASRGAMTKKKGREYIFEIVKIATGEDITEYSTKDWCDEWLLKQSGLASATLTNYRGALRSFLAFLGERQNQTVNGLVSSDITDFREWMIDGTGDDKIISLRTTQQKVKYVGIIMKAAKDEGIIEKNPSAGIKSIDTELPVSRKPFTKETQAHFDK
jgi:hypothetical protein